MTTRGRKPNPSKLVSIKGGRPSRQRSAPPAREAGWTAPRWADLLPGRDQATVRKDAGRFWRVIVDDLEPLGYLSPVDEFLVVEAAVCMARLRQCERVIAREGIVRTTEDGAVLSRHVTAANGYRSALSRYTAELGLSPASRARLARPKAGPSGKAGRLLT